MTMDKAHGRNPERFVRGKPIVKQLPGEVLINRPVTPAQNPESICALNKNWSHSC